MTECEKLRDLQDQRRALEAALADLDHRIRDQAALCRAEQAQRKPAPTKRNR